MSDAPKGWHFLADCVDGGVDCDYLSPQNVTLKEKVKDLEKEREANTGEIKQFRDTLETTVCAHGLLYWPQCTLCNLTARLGTLVVVVVVGGHF